jgi:hypothetical protein
VPFLRAQVGRSTKLGSLLDASLCVLLSLTTYKTQLSSLALSVAFGCSLLLSGALGRCGTGIDMRAILRLPTVGNSSMYKLDLFVELNRDLSQGAPCIVIERARLAFLCIYSFAARLAVLCINSFAGSIINDSDYR